MSLEVQASPFRALHAPTPRKQMEPRRYRDQSSSLGASEHENRIAAISNCPTRNGKPISQGDKRWDLLGKSRHTKPLTKYHAPPNAILRGKVRMEAKMPKLTNNCHKPGIIQVD